MATASPVKTGGCCGVDAASSFFASVAVVSYATAGIVVAVAFVAVAPDDAAGVPLLHFVVAYMLWPYFQLLECMST